MMTADDLKALWEAVTKSTHLAEAHRFECAASVVRANAEAEASRMRYNAELARARAALCVPIGYDLDVLGDGKVKPAGECAKVPSEQLP